MPRKPSCSARSSGQGRARTAAAVSTSLCLPPPSTSAVKAVGEDDFAAFGMRSLWPLATALHLPPLAMRTRTRTFPRRMVMSRR